MKLEKFAILRYRVCGYEVSLIPADNKGFLRIGTRGYPLENQVILVRQLYWGLRKIIQESSTLYLQLCSIVNAAIFSFTEYMDDRFLLFVGNEEVGDWVLHLHICPDVKAIGRLIQIRAHLKRLE